MTEPAAHYASRPLARGSGLIRYLALAYTLLVAYASLYPFAPWRRLAFSAFSFLFEPWPRYTIADVVLNVLGYLPLGLLLTLAAMAWVPSRWAALLATAAGASVSLVLEALQSYLPLRVASNLDLLSNGLGALAGALLGVVAAERGWLSGRFYHLRRRIFHPGAAVDLGFVVLVLWLFAQLYPTFWLFGTGDVRAFLEFPHGLPYSPGSYRWIEAGVTALSLGGVCLLMAALARPQRSIAAPLLAFVAAALLVKTVAAFALFKSADASLWLTPGALLGIPAGVLLFIALVRLPASSIPWLAAAVLMSGVILVNVAPENPYILVSMQTWQRGHFLSFNGTTRLVFSLWPFLAFGYLTWWGWQRAIRTPVAPERPDRVSLRAERGNSDR